MLQSRCRKQKNPMWPFSNLNKIFPCAHSQLQTCNSYELFLLPFYFMYFIPKAETGLETKLQTPVSFINLAASLQSELLLLFLTVYHLKAREYCFYCYCENKSREKNNLELPFSSQSNIMGKKNRGRMSDTQRFFFWAIYRSSGWCCRLQSLNFINGLHWAHLKGQQVFEQWTQAASTSGLQKPSLCLQETG